MSYAQQHMREATEIIQKMDVNAIEKMADLLATVKAEGGRIFFFRRWWQCRQLFARCE